MAYRVELTRQARKQLLALDARQRLMVSSWLRNNLEGCADPRLVAGGKALSGTEGGWRWRVGAYRVLGIILDDRLVIELFRIGHRREVYRNLP